MPRITMKKTLLLVPALAAILFSFSLTGCENFQPKPEEDATPPQEQPSQDEENPAEQPSNDNPD